MGKVLVNIRIYEETRDKLRLLAALRKKRMIEVLDELITAALEAERGRPPASPAPQGNDDKE